MDGSSISDAQVIRHAAAICADRGLSLMLSGLADFAACRHDNADEMDDLADRLSDDFGDLLQRLRDGAAHLRDYPGA